MIGRITKCESVQSSNSLVLEVELKFNREVFSELYQQRLNEGCEIELRTIIDKSLNSDLGVVGQSLSKPRYGKVRNKDKVIFNKTATILYRNGEKYVSKCDSEDTFSEEFGLAMCLLKSFGVSYSDFEKLLKSAKRQGKKDEQEMAN